MHENTTRREFIRNSTLAAGALTTAAATGLPAQPAHSHADHEDYPRHQPGRGGPVGSAMDRSKLVPGLRKPGLAPVPVVRDARRWQGVRGVNRRSWLPGVRRGRAALKEWCLR